MQVEQYHSDDYAGLELGNLNFYYGYEVEDPLTEDWCFQVKKDGEEVYRITRLKIEDSVNNRQLNIPQDYLIAGIGMWLLLKKEKKSQFEPTIEKNKLSPFTCPVCGGNGKVPNGFYNTVTGYGTTSSITPEQCRSCNGSGIVWG